jgi:2-C-methyl-D-erythritol 2,4-cyclodiphosphate synthase
MRVGFGYDIHRLVDGRELILGGIRIDYHLGLIGHSDGDVLIHSIIDSLLGAFSLGDIGMHFPDDDPKYRGISSMSLLYETMKKIPGYIINIDSTVIAQEPRLSPYINDIKKNISGIIDIGDTFISIKAKTNEGVGLIGEKKAIACYSVSLCNKEM